ncbi:MAG: YadA C-terminal domain-containing protein [Megasphaera elsdenii]|nr:YadA C-terminal domain-containing protein [Megasphaera elsdenii]
MKLTNGAEDLTQGVNANTASIQKNSITSLNTHVRNLDQEVDSVGALSAALTGLHPIDYDGTESRFQISAAAGTYDGKQAVALGGFYHANRDVMFSLGTSSTFGNDRKAAGNIGVTFRVGPSANHTVDNQNNNDIEMLKAEIQELKAEIRALKSK